LIRRHEDDEDQDDPDASDVDSDPNASEEKDLVENDGDFDGGKLAHDETKAGKGGAASLEKYRTGNTPTDFDLDSKPPDDNW